MDPIPDVGEQTASILAELGLDSDEIDRLFAAGVVGDPSHSSVTA